MIFFLKYAQGINPDAFDFQSSGDQDRLANSSIEVCDGNALFEARFSLFGKF
jgi:hypothetical protein